MPDTLSANFWPTTTLAECVEEIAHRVDNPAESGFDRFVGLEHIETGDIAIRRWGSTDDVTSSMKVFRAGDVIVARRNVYLRRAARAAFDGVCSGDGIVLRARSEVCIPELLPFLLNTASFWNYVTSQADGTMSKRITVKRLLSYEFSLPSIDEQRRLVEVLAATSDAEELYLDLLTAAKRAEEAAFYHMLFDRDVVQTGGSVNNDWARLRPECPLVPINALADVAYGISAAVAQNTKKSIGWPILTGANISLNGTLSLHKLVYHPAPTKSDFKLRKGDVLLNWRSGSAEHVGKAALFDLDGDWTFASFILRIRVGPRLDNRFLWRLLNFMRERQLFGKSISQQINFKMNATYFRSVDIPCPPIATQERIVNELSALWRGISLIEARSDGLRALRNRILARGGQ